MDQTEKKHTIASTMVENVKVYLWSCTAPLTLLIILDFPIHIDTKKWDNPFCFKRGQRSKLQLTCVKQPLSKRPKIGFQDQLLLNAGQKYCRMLPLEHSAILLTFIKLPFVIKIFDLSIFESPFYIGSMYFCSWRLFYLSKQCRPWWNAALCSISSGSLLFATVPV